MTRSNFPEQPGASQLAQRVTVLKEQLRALQDAIGAESLAERTGVARYKETPERGKYALNLWQQPIQLSYPDWIATDSQTGQALSVATQALLLYYFITADGERPEAHWISFADLPDGRFYNQAFQGYSGSELARAFQNDLESFDRAARQIGGKLLPAAPETPGDRAFVFQALPRLAVLTVYWQGDEDFPAAAQVLFEITTPHYLPTDVCAILGSTLTRRLIKQKETYSHD
jgi:hypothetical protein